MKITLGGNQTEPVSVAGSQFYLLSTSLGEKIRVKIVGGGDARSFDLSPGMGFKDFNGTRWYSLEIENLSSYQQDIEFEVSDREVFDNRVTFGSGSDVLQVENQYTRKTDQSKMFSGSFTSAADAAKYSCVGIYNNLDQDIYVSSAECSLGLAGLASGPVILGIIKYYDWSIIDPFGDDLPLYDFMFDAAISGYDVVEQPKIASHRSDGNLETPTSRVVLFGGRVKDEPYTHLFTNSDASIIQRCYINAQGAPSAKFSPFSHILLKKNAALFYVAEAVNQQVIANFQFYYA